MKFLCIFIAIAALLISSVLCDDSSATISIDGKVVAPRNDLIKGNIKILVDAGQVYSTYARNDGSFTLHNLAQGQSYILEISCPNVQYPQIRLDVSRSGKVRALVNDPSKKHIKSDPSLQIYPLGKQEYFQKREPFDIWGLLKNPMALMVIFGVLVIFVFPKIASPEAMKEFNETMKQNEKDFKGMWSSIKGEGGDQQPQQAAITNKKRD